jgi:hypothetical protein
MPERNLLGHHHPDTIDKGIQRGLHDINRVPCPEMPPGLTGAPMRPDPHGAGPRAPVHVTPGRAMPEHRPPGLLPANGAINPDPHPYNPASQVQQANTYAVPRWESKFK